MAAIITRHIGHNAIATPSRKPVKTSFAGCFHMKSASKAAIIKAIGQALKPGILK